MRSAIIILPLISVCGGDYFTETGEIRSPGWPENYQPSKECIWKISVPHGRQIELNFKSFEIEAHKNCRFDYLEVRNGGNELSPLIGTYCSTTYPMKLRSFGNQLYLKFKSDSSRNYAGFNLEWDATSTGCGGVLTSSRGSITSPNYPEPYGNYAQCVWKIIVSEGSTINLSFLDLDLEEQDNCRFDKLEILDGPDAASESLGVVCVSNNQHVQFNSTGNALYLRLSTDASQQGRGFSLNYKINCNRVITGHKGIIESPNFPNMYPNYFDCKWTIRAPPGNKINVQFSHFALEPSRNDAINCDYDFLKIEQMKDNAALSTEKYCNGAPESFTSVTQELIFTFHSDASEGDIGFRLEWQVEGCGGLLTHPEGFITSPNYPNYYPLNTHCEWTIVTDIGKTIEFTIEDFDVEMASDCRFDGLIVSNLNDESQVIGRYCHPQTEPKKITGNSHKLFVKFYSDKGQQRKGFRASYRTIPSGE